MANTFVQIASVTVGSGGAANIDFSSIPATYTDLVIYLSLRDETTNGFPVVTMEINGVTTDRTWKRLRGDGSAASSTNATTGEINTMPGANKTASTFGSIQVYLPNYAGSTNKSFSVDGVAESNATAADTILNAGLWSQTTAINQLTFKSASATDFNQHSTATLYGIKKN
jgi:hypothetical protein